MKKIFTLLLCLASFGASAQQVNGDFDQTWENCTPFGGDGKTQGTEPFGWQASNTRGMKGTGAATFVSSTTGRNETTAVNLTNGETGFFRWKSVVPAYICLGTPWATAVGLNKTDGGSFGGVKNFKYRPDSIEVYYKHTNASGSTQPATIVAYLWSGTYTQESVPYTIVSSGSPSTMTMIDRDRQILDKDFTNAQGGSRSTTNGKLIAVVDHYITNTTNEWTQLKIKFDYKDINSKPENINIILAANDYWATRSSNVKGDQLIVDNVTLIYNSSLSALEFNGKPIIDFAKDKYEYTIDDGYTDGCITFTKDCVGGDVDEYFEPSSNSYIITVKGDDYDSNPSNTHTYTVKFTKVIINDGDDINEVGHISGGTVVLNRTFKAGWNTVCLPFPVKYDKLGTNVTTYILSTPSGDAITFSQTSSAIAKNTPFLANFPSEVNSITFTSRTINEDKTPLVKTCGYWTFTGSYEPSISMEGKWGVVNDGSKVRKGGTSSTLKSTRAYLEYNGIANVNEMRIIIDGEETTITEIDGMPVGNFDVYNLQGVRVRQNVNSLDGLNKGIYIVNGKKHIVK